MVILANLLVTRAVWRGGTDPLSEELKKEGDRYWIKVFHSPAEEFRITGEAAQRAALRELNDWDDVTDVRPFYLVATSPPAAEALAKVPNLLAAIKARQSRLKCAAIGDETAFHFWEALKAHDLGPERYRQILVPTVSGHFDKLADSILVRAKPGTMVGLLESAEDSNALAQKLISGGARVVRLPIYSRSTREVIDLPNDGTPWWVLVTSSLAAKATLLELNRQKVDLKEVTWIGSVPAIGQAIQKQVPGARWVNVDDLTADRILDAIAKA
ncbi:MAG: uroporphyrinogen-III synthase [Bordetella sp.]|jgi:uroporphyrinogen-III synthase